MTNQQIFDRLEQLEQLVVAKKPGAQDVDAMNARTERLELLYALHKRDEAPQGLAHTYTALTSEHANFVEGLRVHQ